MMISEIEALIWSAAIIIWAGVLGRYLVGVYEFRDWKWPWR